MTNYRKEWEDAGVYHCHICDEDFVVLSPGGEGPQFCPFCATIELGRS